MSFVEYVRIFRKWLWLILLAAFVAGGISFIIVMRQPPIYKTQTTISIGRFIYSPNPNSSEIRTGIDLAQTYAKIVTTYDVLQGTISELNLQVSADDLRGHISTDILDGTSLLVVAVTYDDPILAADIANTLAQQLIANSPTNLTSEQQEQLTFLQAQIQDLAGQIDESRTQLQTIDEQLKGVTSTAESERLTNQRNEIITQINEAQSAIAQYTNTVAALQLRTNALDIVERARVPSATTGTNMWVLVIIGVVLGAGGAGGLVLLLEDMDDTIRNTEDATQTLMVPVFGAITRFGKRAKNYSDMLITNFPTMSPVAEGYRSARTNMLFSDDQGTSRVFIVTSPNQQEGKTVTTINLAVVLAQAGLRVLLIDADLRRPRVHEAFKLKNEVGLTTLLYTDPPRPDQFNGGENVLLSANFLRCVQNTDVPLLRVLTSGFIPSNPSEVLGSQAMKQWIDAFRSAPTIDIVVIDTPPTLAVADSQVLAASTEAEVILVVDCGRTRRGAALRAKELFSNLGIEPKGVIVNRVNPSDEPYSYYYGYYTPLKPTTNGNGSTEKSAYAESDD